MTQYALDIAIYVVCWWIVLFAVLPFGVKPSREGELGHDAGAPAQPYLLRKALITTVVAAVVWALLHWGMTDYIARLRRR